MSFDSLQEAEKKNLLSPIPTTFTVCGGDFKKITVSTGSDKDDHTESGKSLQLTKLEVSAVNNRLIQLIDTPGISNPPGDSQDKTILEYMLSTIHQLGEIHAIGILLKPNDANLNLIFDSCIHKMVRDVGKYIIFCFTNSRPHFTDLETLSALEALLEEHKIDISISKDTITALMVNPSDS